jgi:CBS domain-containing protein
MLVADLMKQPAMTVRPDTTLMDAARIMLANRISGLPVVDAAGQLVGMVTEDDLLKRAELDTEGGQPGWLKTIFFPSATAADYVRTHGRQVEEVMSRHPLTVTKQTPLADVTALMHGKRIKRLPVIEDGRVIGIISRADILAALAAKLIEVKPAFTDLAIKDSILTTLKRERWAPQSGIRVEVKDSVVTLEGIIFSDDERQAVHVIAENTQGVKKVNDNLVYVDPGSGMAIPAM